MKIKINQRIQELSGLIERYNREYHQLDEPSVSDSEYDTLFAELKTLEEQYPELAQPSSPTQRVGAEPLNHFSNAIHLKPMLSLDNAFCNEEVLNFYTRLQDQLAEQVIELVCEPKLDGVAISLLYQNGKLIRAATRGDGHDAAVAVDLQGREVHLRVLPDLGIDQTGEQLGEQAFLQALGRKGLVLMDRRTKPDDPGATTNIARLAKIDLHRLFLHDGSLKILCMWTT